MDLYDFIHGLLIWTVTVAAAWPLNVPMLAVAFKIQTGAKRLPLDREQLWWRSAFAALFIALVAIVLAIFDYIFTDWAELPAGPTHLVVLGAFVPLAAWVLFVMFAHSELFEGFGLFIIYIYLPVFVLFLLNKIVGFWNPLLNLASSWIKPIV